jgi:hypothetical protein
MNPQPPRLAPSAVCATCRRRLLPYENRDGAGNVVDFGYEHPKMLPGVTCDRLEPLLFDSDDRQPDQVSVCDFCGCAGVSWDYPADDFPVPNDPHMVMVGMWSACHDCHEDIERERWVHMAFRQCKVYGVLPTQDRVAHFVNIFKAFAAHRRGEATAI